MLFCSRSLAQEISLAFVGQTMPLTWPFSQRRGEAVGRGSQPPLTYSLPSILICLLFLIDPSGCSPTCNYSSQSCGGMQIPYPFGMVDGCGLPQYRVVCKQNASYGDGNLPFLPIGTSSTSELQVMSFKTDELVVNSTFLKAMPSPEHCNQQDVGHASLVLREGAPFMLAANNWFVVVGCNSYGALTAVDHTGEPTLISCHNGCYDQFILPFCNSFTCCSSLVPPHSWRVDFNGTGIQYKYFPGVCGFSTILNPATFEIPVNERAIFARGRYGMSLSWALPRMTHETNCSAIRERADYACHAKATCSYNSRLQSYTCSCTRRYRGDGYKDGLGCHDIDECAEGLDNCQRPPFGTCTNTDGSFICKCTFGGWSGLGGTCLVPIRPYVPILLLILFGGLVGAASLAGILVFVCVVCISYRRRRKRRENFRRAGGDQLKSYLFSEKELEKATNTFSKSHVIGEGGFGEVYWGILSTGRGKRKVAIKKAKPKAVDQQVAQMQSFVKEIILLSKTVHKNVVELLGCCVETSVPLLVFEFVEKGNLRDYLKPQEKDFSGFLRRFKHNSVWAWRLHVAVQTAEALSYLHEQREPIFHLDLKPHNILIDKNYDPKVADFGLSCFLTTDATHLTNPIMAGTFGYVDPEYGYTFRVTDRYDVFSFGVILLELISAQPAFGPSGVLAHYFSTDVDVNEEISKHANHLPSFVDSRLESDPEALASIQEVAAIARSCVAMKGSDRPSMREAYHQLEQVRLKHPSCTWQAMSSNRGGHVGNDSFPSTAEELPLFREEYRSNRWTA